MLDLSIITIVSFLILPLSGLLLLPVLIQRMAALDAVTSNATSISQVRKNKLR